jgi:hypothetical protein
VSDFNSLIQAAVKGGSSEMGLGLLASINEKMDRILRLMELRLVQAPQPQPSFSGPIPIERLFQMTSRAPEDEPPVPKVDMNRIPVQQPTESNIMRDSAGNPEIIRYPLPFGHGTIIYRKIPGDVAPWGFTLSVQGPDGIPRKFERVPDTTE